MKRMLVVALATSVVLMAAQAFAGAITFTGTTVGQNGTGFGNVMNVLRLQNNGSEWGGVSWNGSTDVKTDHAIHPATQTRTVSEMLAAGLGADNFALVFNVNQTGVNTNVVLRDFYMDFYDATGAVLGTVKYDFINQPYFTGTNNLEPVQADGTPGGNGSGSAGWLFTVDFSSVPSFWTTGSNRLGMRVLQDDSIINGIGGSNDGPENFYIQQASATVIPLPAAAWMGMALFGSIGGVGYFRRRRVQLI